jgi:threonine dehydrogenase-like Zn-dependent dehydrogenase
VEEKLKEARDLGADETINAAKQDPVKTILELTQGDGVDIAIEMVGKTQTIKNTFDSVRRGGKAVLVGLSGEDFPFDTRTIVRKEMQVIGSYAYSKWDLEKVVELAATRRLNLSKTITHKFPLNEVNKGIEILDKGLGAPFNVVIEIS